MNKTDTGYENAPEVTMGNYGECYVEVNGLLFSMYFDAKRGAIEGHKASLIIGVYDNKTKSPMPTLLQEIILPVVGFSYGTKFIPSFAKNSDGVMIDAGVLHVGLYKKNGKVSLLVRSNDPYRLVLNQVFVPAHMGVL